MGRRNLSSEEQALWTALTRSVRPLRPGARTPVLPAVPVKATDVKGLTLPSIQAAAAAPARTPATILDSGWERRIRSGNLAPDMTIDLHGHSLAAAHARLNQALAAAWARDARTMLVITGKPPKTASVGGSRRGAIRGEIGHWLETGSHADRIASVRVAHPRHGGDGALYVILRRKK
ncbi:Smr/MutS family protein [Sphingobium chlorophenolicum]|uniref:Smr protein/MutS2 n=1 Tax=Sphingobium chlorophenolicum TaxID=46429 RepID=A0A081R944_SPHCR|nr:Smr/MutS family protein [Sphingobium chlorophenolicum]KEQ51717.1 Smr protein/MutS2 [Sphingobium chlorophenolicum]